MWLSEIAKEMIKDVAISRTGMLIKNKSLGSYFIGANGGKNFISNRNDLREVKTIENAVNELEQSGLIIAKGKLGFEITKKGLDFADSL